MRFVAVAWLRGQTSAMRKRAKRSRMCSIGRCSRHVQRTSRRRPRRSACAESADPVCWTGLYQVSQARLMYRKIVAAACVPLTRKWYQQQHTKRSSPGAARISTASTSSERLQPFTKITSMICCHPQTPHPPVTPGGVRLAEAFRIRRRRRSRAW